MNEFLDNMKKVKRGGEGLGIGEKYPVSEYGTPTMTDEQSATHEQMVEAGFHEADRYGDDKPKLIDQDGNVIDQSKLRFCVLRDEDGAIVATWDEGRWWSLQESQAFLAALVDPAVRQMAEATSQFKDVNRRARRRGRYGTNEGDKWLSPGSEVQNRLDADGEGMVLINEMLVKDGELQECVYVTDNPEMIAEAQAGHELWIAAQAEDN